MASGASPCDEGHCEAGRIRRAATARAASCCLVTCVAPAPALRHRHRHRRRRRPQSAERHYAMFMNDVDIFPHPEDILWLCVLMAVTQQVRKRSSITDEPQRALMFEALATAECMSARFALDLRRAYSHGVLGIGLWLTMHGFLSHLRSFYWKGNEITNPSTLLARAYAHEGIPDANCILLAGSQLVGGGAGYIYMELMSYPRKVPRCCRLPLRVEPLTAAILEATGAFLLELMNRGFRNSECETPAHGYIFYSIKQLADVGLKLTMINLSGAVFHPVAAFVFYNRCILDKRWNFHLFVIYMVSPCIGSLFAVGIDRYAQMLVRRIHHQLHR